MNIGKDGSSCCPAGSAPVFALRPCFRGATVADDETQQGHSSWTIPGDAGHFGQLTAAKGRPIRLLIPTETWL